MNKNDHLRFELNDEFGLHPTIVLTELERHFATQFDTIENGRLSAKRISSRCHDPRLRLLYGRRALGFWTLPPEKAVEIDAVIIAVSQLNCSTEDFRDPRRSALFQNTD